MEIPKYNYPVSLIPGGCPQFLDFEITLNDLPRFNRGFAEEKKQGATDADRQNYLLHCLEEDENGAWRDQISHSCDYASDYEIEGKKSLDPFLNQWFPIPVLRIKDINLIKGEPTFFQGPANWVRCYLKKTTQDKLRVIMVFETSTETLPENENSYFALSPEDVAAIAIYSLAWHVKDNTWFLNAPWMDRWLFSIFRNFKRTQRKTADDEFAMEYLAYYLTLLEILHRALPDFQVKIINAHRDNPVDVDLIIDIGNSRTNGILVETLPQSSTDLNNSYLLQIRDLTQPENVYAEPFATRVEFSEASFGDQAHSKLSGRKTTAFVWASAVRMGPEAARLATQARNAEGATGLSSPKRYLWDEKAYKPTWRYNTGGNFEPMATRGSFVQQLNHLGTPIACLDDPEITRNPIYKNQEKEIVFESNYTRSSLMMFLLAEVLMQALVTINSPAGRARRELSDVAPQAKTHNFYSSHCYAYS